ncbi:MAG: OmpA family protein [Terriglobia bacterium]
MKTLGRALTMTLLVLGGWQAAAAQGYEPPRRANHKDVYCSGFVAATPVPADLRIVMALDAVGRIIYSQYDYVYLSHGRNGEVQEGARYLVVRPVNDPDPVEAFQNQQAIFHAMGQLYQDLGTLEVKTVHETTATAQVLEACDAIQAGDILIPYQQRPLPEFKPRQAFDRFAPPSGLAEGTVIMGKEFAHLMGRGDVVYVNLGTNQGVNVGDYYTLYRYGSGTLYAGYDDMGRGFIRRERGMPRGHELPRLRQDLPREVIGEAFVVHVDQSSSTAVITLSLMEAHAGDFVEVQPPAPPLAELAAFPARIQRGQSAILTWEVQAADQASLNPGIGAVERKGSVEVTPQATTTFTLSASGRGGEAEDMVTVTVVAPPPPPRRPPPPPRRVTPPIDQLFAQSVEDVFFEFGKAEITEQAMGKLRQAAEFLRNHPGVGILIEGHADEIGSEQINQALGERRAEAVKNLLVSLGVDPSRLRTVSLGEAQPFCTESSEDWCRALNRRAHFVLQR